MLLILWGIFLLGNILSLSDRVHTLIHGKMVQCPRTRASAIFIVRSSGKRGEVDKYESCTWTWKWASVIFLPHWDEINKIVQVSVQSKTSCSEIHKILKQLIGYLWPNMVFASATYNLWLNTISNFILYEQQTRYVTKLCRVTILLWDTLISKLKLRDRPDHLLFSLTKPIRVTTCEHKFLKWWFLREYLFIALLFRNISFSCNDVPFKLSGGNSFSEIYTPQNIPPPNHYHIQICFYLHKFKHNFPKHAI